MATWQDVIGRRFIIVPILVLAAAVVGMASFSRPAIVPAGAPPEAFSAERAMEHIRPIAREPHPVGSPELAQVRAYIVAELEAMGLSPEVQETTVAVSRPHT